MVLMTTKERLENLRAEQEKLYAADRELHKQIIENQSQVMRGLLVEYADEHPTVISFRFSAQYEYDDEGSYFWCSSIQSESQPESEEDPFDFDDDLIEVEHEGDEASTPVAFEAKDKWEGEITVARLRELWEAA